MSFIKFNVKLYYETDKKYIYDFYLNIQKRKLNFENTGS